MVKGKKRKCLLLGMVIVLLLPLLAACGEDGDDTPKIKIGIGVPLKADTGLNGLHMAEMAAQEINEAGGVDVGGVMYDIELITADTNEPYSPADAAAATERLITVDGVDFFIGAITSEGALPVMEILADQKVVGIVFASSSDIPNKIRDDYDRYKYVFDGLFGPKLALNTLLTGAILIGNELKEKTKVEDPIKVALLFQKGGAYDPVVPALNVMLPRFGFEVVGAWRPGTDATDLTAEFRAIENAGAHIILEANSGPAMIVMARQWGELQIPAALAGPNPYGDVSFWDATGGYCEYQIQTNVGGYIALTPRTIPFMEKLEETYGEAPTVGINTYDMLYALVDAIERAGTLDDDAVITTMEQTDYVGALGNIAFQGLDEGEETHRIKEGKDYIFMTYAQWRDGRMVTVWPDGNPLPWDSSWEGVRFEGTQDFVLPPWVITYWNK